MNNYPAHGWHYYIGDYKDVEGEWLPCPKCGLVPKIRIFDNGRSTACGCWKSKYDNFSIHAESIRSVAKRCDGSIADYDFDELRLNWNHWCKTGEELFLHAGKRDDGRW